MTHREITDSFKKRIIAAAESLAGQPGVTKSQVARKAGVYKGMVTMYVARYPDVKTAIDKVRVLSVKEKILDAIEFFRSRGLKASQKLVARKAKVSSGSITYLAKSSALIRSGLKAIKPLTAKEKVLKAIKEIREEKRYLSINAVLLRSKVNEITYRRLRKNDSDVIRQLDIGLHQPTVESRIYQAIHKFHGRDDVVATRKSIAYFARICLDTLCKYENMPNSLIKKALNEILPLSSDQKIEMALRRLVLKNVFPRAVVLAKEAILAIDTVYHRMEKNGILAERIRLARKRFLDRKNSITNKREQDVGWGKLFR